LEINERINKIAWCCSTNGAHHLLSTNDKTIKLWRIRHRQPAVLVENNRTVTEKLVSTDVQLPLMLPRTVKKEAPVVSANCQRVYGHAHAYHIHSLSVSADEETFLSADDLRVNLWNLQGSTQSFSKFSYLF